MSSPCKQLSGHRFKEKWLLIKIITRNSKLPQELLTAIKDGPDEATQSDAIRIYYTVVHATRIWVLPQILRRDETVLSNEIFEAENTNNDPKQA